MRIEGQVGPQALADGANSAPRLEKTSGLVVQELHGRFYEQVYRGNVYSTGMSVTSINNATFTSATLGVTCTPILGLWNPTTSGKNLVILQAMLTFVLTALQSTGGGPFVWASSTNNGNISTGNAPWSRLTLTQVGSAAKAFNASPALTGLTNNLVVMEGSEMACSMYNASLLATAAGFMTETQGYVQNFDGSLIVPPGGVIALLATTTPVANSAAGRLLWEEVPV